MKKLTGIAVGACLALTSVAFATPYQQQFVANFDAVKAACEDPVKFHNQKAPTGVKVTCQDIQTKWLPDMSGEHNLNMSRMVSARVNSDKYNSSEEKLAIATPDYLVACPAFKEVIATTDLTVDADCNQLLKEPSGPLFCQRMIDKAIETNPNAVVMKDTGNTFKMCAAPALPPKQDQVQAPKQGQLQPGQKVKQQNYQFFHPRH